MASAQQQGEGPAPGGAVSGSGASPDQEKLQQLWRETSALYEKVADNPLRVADVRVTGAARTRRDVLQRELKRVKDATSLREVHAALEVALEHLGQLEAFRRVEAMIDAPDGGAAADECTVVLGVTERDALARGAHTFVESNEAYAQAALGLRNALGAADQWALTGELGHRNSSYVAASVRLPRAGGTGVTPDLRVFRRCLNLGPYSSFEDTMRGAEVGVASADGASRLSYTWGWRSLAAAPEAGRPVAAQRGDFLSDALRWTYIADERDSSAVHTEGWGAKLVSELGGLYPGAGYKYAKARADWAWAAPLTATTALNVSLAAGVLYPIPGGAAGAAPRRASGAGDAAAGGAAPASCLGDRFFLGGVDSVRGFAYRGIGPSAERRGGGGGGDPSADGGGGGNRGDDALGGDAFASLYAALISRLPGAAGDAGAYAHAFVNGGALAPLAGGGGGERGGGGGGGGAAAALAAAARRKAAGLAAECRWSAGVGLVVPTPLGRFEANYVWLLSSQPGDHPRAGLQLGFAASPLAQRGAE